jgi:hypothetical protein
MVQLGNQKGFSLIGLLFKLALLCLIVYLANRFYMHVMFDREMRNFLGREGISTDGLTEMVESFKDKADQLGESFDRQKHTIDKLFDEGK